MFLLWFDDTKKKPAEEKILEGVQRYVERFGETPNVCLVNPSEAVQAQGIVVRPTAYVRPNNYWIGVETVSAANKPAGTGTRKRAKKAA